MKKKYKIIFATLVTAIILISIFAVMIQTGILKLDITSTKIEEGRPLFLKIFTDKNSGTIPFGVNFTSLILYEEGAVSYKWDFGDGNTSDEKNPSYVYQENGTFNCSLTVTDSTGRKYTDIAKIFVTGNQAPTGQIFTDLRPTRPYIPFLIGFINKFESIYRQLLYRGVIPASLLTRMNFVSLRAEASDPEGDEIVSYEWILKPPVYSTFTGEQVKPEYKFYGKEIEIPLIYVYTTYTYKLTLLVTDSKGNVGTTTEDLEVKISQPETFYYTIKSYKDSILGPAGLWHTSFKSSLRGPFGKLIADYLLPLIPRWPLLKLLLILRVKKNLDIDVPGGIAKQLVQFIKKHPAVLKITNGTLNGLKSVFENLKQKYPERAIFDKLINLIQLILEGLELDNKRPVISDPFPENETKNIPLNCPYVSIKVNDSEGNPFNITISGDYVNDITYTNQYNGTFNATLNTSLPPRTKIHWHVKVVDQNEKVVEKRYWFKTFSI